LSNHRYSIAAAKSTVFTASLSRASLTTDGGQTWSAVKPPSDLKQVTSVAVDDFGGLWIGVREGVYLSEDKGAT
jgi:ligand-binding sensor domain-containing protein